MNLPNTQPTCEQRINGYLAYRLTDFRRFAILRDHGITEPDDWLSLDVPDRVQLCQGLNESIFTARHDDVPDFLHELGSPHDYGLAIDYVEPDTFPDQEEGFIRYQLSWGGPSDEFRFYFSPIGGRYRCHRVEYWFLDWNDGASRTLYNDEKTLLCAIFDDWNDCDSIDYWIKEAAE